MVRRYKQDTDYQIGESPQNMLPLRRLGVPQPDLAPGSSASVYYVRADATRVGDGYTAVSWIWDVISGTDLFKLTSFLGGEDWTPIYIKTDIREAEEPYPRQQFDVYYGMMWKPVLTGDEGQPIARSPYAYQSVRLQFIDLVVQPGYL